MLLALERDQFIKLYKFGELSIHIDRFIDGVGKEEKWADIPLEVLESHLPPFEQSHEILLLHLSKDRFATSGILENKLNIKFYDILKIYPLTTEAKRYLVGRFHPKISIGEPILEKKIRVIEANRSWILREKAAKALQTVFDAPGTIETRIKEEIESGLNNRIQGTYSIPKSYLSHLIRFDRKPIFPEGPIEYLFKVGLIYTESQGRQEADFRKLPLYKFLDSGFNCRSNNLFDCLYKFEESEESKPLLTKLADIDKSIDLFWVSIYYLFCKDVLNKNRNDLSKIKSDIIELKRRHPAEASTVLYMLGMLFSFENLNESLYEITQPPLFSDEQRIEVGVRLKKMERELIVSEELVQDLRKQNSSISDELHSIKESLVKQSFLSKSIDNDLFDQIDTNHDGHLEPNEIMEFWRKLAEARNYKESGSSPDGIDRNKKDGPHEYVQERNDPPNMKVGLSAKNIVLTKLPFDDYNPIASDLPSSTNDKERIQLFIKNLGEGLFDTDSKFNIKFLKVIRDIKTLKTLLKKIEEFSSSQKISENVRRKMIDFVNNPKAS